MNTSYLDHSISKAAASLYALKTIRRHASAIKDVARLFLLHNCYIPVLVARFYGRNQITLKFLIRLYVATYLPLDMETFGDGELLGSVDHILFHSKLKILIMSCV